MAVKLNLTISEDAVRRIKDFAAINNTSVSRIFEDHINNLTIKHKKIGKSFVEKFAGTLNNHIPDVNEARDEYLKEKYGL